MTTSTLDQTVEGRLRSQGVRYTTARRAVVAVRQAEWRAAGGESGTALSMAILALRLGEPTGAHAATHRANF